MNQLAAEKPNKPTTATKTFIALVVAHAMGDLLGGNWPIFKKLAELDLATAGIIGAVTTSVFTAVQPLCGFYADRGHRRLLVVVGAGLTLVTALFGPIVMVREQIGDTAMYVLFFVLLSLIRLGQSFFHPPGTSIAGNTSARRRSTLVAVFITCGMIGYASNWLVFSWVWRTFDRQTMWLLVPFVPMLLFVWWWCRPMESRHESHPPLRAAFAQLAPARRPLLLLYFVQVMMTAHTVGLQFLLPEFGELRGYPPFIENGGSLFLLIAGGAVMMVPAGHIADRFGRRRTLNVMVLLSLASYVPMVLIDDLPLWGFCVLCSLMGGFNMAAGPIVIAMAQHLAPRSESLISGVVMGLAWALGNVSMAIMGVLAEQESVGVVGALQWLSLAGVLALPLAWVVPKVADNHD